MISETAPANLEDGTVDTQDIFDLDILSDAELLHGFRNSIQDSKNHWNKKYDLDNLRTENRKLWLAQHYDPYDLYEHQTEYIDNRIFIDVEASIAYTTARVGQSEVYPAQDTDMSKNLAESVEKATRAHAEMDKINKKARRVARHNFLSHLGLAKMRYDEQSGRIVTDVVDPKRVVISKEAMEDGNPRFIAEYIEASIAELIQKFPDKEPELRKKYGIIVGTQKQLSQVVDYVEIWFTYFDDDYNSCEGMVAFVDSLVLGKMKNPNWIYKNTKEVEANFLDYPPKPYIPLNAFNDGLTYIDPTGAIQQAKRMQYNLNKRGRQITDNADYSNAGWVFSGKAITKPEAENLIGAPNEKIIVDAEDVRTAVQRFPAPLLPQYVVQDKYDARAQIDAIFATSSSFKGEGSNNKTLGQDVLEKEQSQIRQDIYIDAIDEFMDRYYKMLVQFMKVYYDEDQWYKYLGDDGRFVSVAINADKIEDGIDIKVSNGSSVAVDKDRMQVIALQLSKANKISTLDLYKALQLPDPEQMYENWVKESVDPTLLVEDIKKEEFEESAFEDITILNAGKVQKPTENISKEHLDFHRRYMLKSEFINSSDKVKKLHVDHVTLETEALRQILLAEETQLPTDQENQGLQEKMMAAAGQITPQGQPNGMPPQQGSGQPANVNLSALGSTPQYPPGTPKVARNNPQDMVQ